MIVFNIITLFPDLFDPFLQHLPLKRALEKNLVKVNLIQLRDFAIDERGTVDGRPYGGGVGMILRVEPVYKALESVYTSVEEAHKDTKNSIIALSPSGETFTQKKARALKEKDTITFICGRYEGMDARIKDNLATDVISVGNYVLSGGELPALTIMEAITRLIPGVLEKREAVQIESFSGNLDDKEFPQYTRPDDFKGMRVPDVLLSGDHGAVDRWREKTQGDTFI